MQIILLGIFTIKKHVREEVQKFIKINCELSDSLISLCSKGPSFIPTQNTFDWRQLQIDFDKF